MSDAEQLELSWLFWPHGAYKQFAMEVNERQLFVLDLPNETARLLGEAFRQSAAAAEARGWARAVEALRDAQNRPDHTHDWAIMRHAADHLESLAASPTEEHTS